jgi:hypothetical protein
MPNFTVPQLLTIAEATPGAATYWTNNGVDPTESDTPYTAPILITDTVTIKAKAFLATLDPSEVATITFTKANTIYWGYTTSRILNEAGVLALQNSSSEADPFRDYAFPATPTTTAGDYFTWWIPDSMDVPTALNGFWDVGSSVALTMAQVAEGYVNGPTNGWYYLNLVVGGIPGKLYSTFFPLGGGPSIYNTRIQ